MLSAAIAIGTKRVKMGAGRAWDNLEIIWAFMHVFFAPNTILQVPSSICLQCLFETIPASPHKQGFCIKITIVKLIVVFHGKNKVWNFVK